MDSLSLLKIHYLFKIQIRSLKRAIIDEVKDVLIERALEPCTAEPQLPPRLRPPRQPILPSPNPTFSF